MSNKLTLPVEEEPKKVSRTSLKSIPVTGKLTSLIGSGEHAKDSFVYVTITWSFVIGSAVTTVIFIKSFFDASDSCDLVDGIKTIWTIFVPLITLALGYAFGKGK